MQPARTRPICFLGFNDASKKLTSIHNVGNILVIVFGMNDTTPQRRHQGAEKLRIQLSLHTYEIVPESEIVVCLPDDNEATYSVAVQVRWLW